MPIKKSPTPRAPRCSAGTVAARGALAIALALLFSASAAAEEAQSTSPSPEGQGAGEAGPEAEVEAAPAEEAPRREEDRAGFQPLGFSRLILKPEGRHDLVADDGRLRLAILERLRSQGYNVVGAESLVFDHDRTAEAAFLLGGTITDIQCASIGRYGSDAVCATTITWELLDRRREEIVYQVTTRHRVRRSASSMHREPARLVYDLVLGAAGSLTSRSLFNDMLRGDADELEDPDFEPADFARCDREALALPADMGRVLGAAVLITAGNRSGSGFFISPDGLLLTAAHVVEGRTGVGVKTHHGETATATVLRRSREADVALLSIDGQSPACLPLAAVIPSAGSDIFVVGSPISEELAFSTSRGVMSGMRRIAGSDFMQTDAALNPGNSGGPMVGEAGEVVAVVSWKVGLSGVEGLGFGVPIERALERLGLGPGEETTLVRDEPAPADEAEQELPIVDAADPPIDVYSAALDYSARSIHQRPRVSYFHSPHRGWFLSSSVTLALGGGLGVFTSWLGVHHHESQYERGTIDFETWDKRFETWKHVNTGSWIGAGLGAAGMAYFIMTPRTILPQRPPPAEGDEAAVARAVEAPRLEIGFDGSMIFVRGGF